MASNLLISFYGDDFTGSTDALEALTTAGVPAMLFVEPPSPEQLARYPHIRAAGVAGISRSLSPEVMRRELPPIFSALKALGAPITHYKVCSTFDSSPTVGSIGTAIDLGAELFQAPFVPVVAGSLGLGRYCVFGNLFARAGLDTEPYRLDRHPSMSRHPITPMDEADLRLHLARQTEKSIALFDVLKLDGPDPGAAFQTLLTSRPEIVLFDTLTPNHYATIGALIQQHATPERPLFAAGSSGVEYALTAHWRQTGQLPEPPKFFVKPVCQTIVVSGSCSPVTQRQILWALDHGFEAVALNTTRLLTPSEAEAELRRATATAQAILGRGRSPILHTALGPTDPRLEPTRAKLAELEGTSSQLLGTALGRLLKTVWQATDLTRAVITGGDTSGYVARELGVEALEMAGPAVPGSPLCHLSAPGNPLHGRELIFKGGQVGRTEFFGTVLRP
jgi:uncharacterized protein YgbK (DUF1537 family)